MHKYTLKQEGTTFLPEAVGPVLVLGEGAKDILSVDKPSNGRVIAPMFPEDKLHDELFLVLIKAWVDEGRPLDEGVSAVLVEGKGTRGLALLRLKENPLIPVPGGRFPFEFSTPGRQKGGIERPAED